MQRKRRKAETTINASYYNATKTRKLMKRESNRKVSKLKKEKTRKDEAQIKENRKKQKIWKRACSN